MKVKITEDAILRAVDFTGRDFDIKLLYKLLDKMPTVYYKQIIVDEFFSHLCGVKFYEVYDTVTNSHEYFFTMGALEKYCVQKKIARKSRIFEAISDGGFVQKRYLIRSFASSDEYEAPDVTSRDTGGILDCSIYRTKPVNDSEVDGVAD